jgi:hypothetical protein
MDVKPSAQDELALVELRRHQLQRLRTHQALKDLTTRRPLEFGPLRPITAAVRALIASGALHE